VIFGTAGVGVDSGEFRLIKATRRLFGECIIAVNATPRIRLALSYGTRRPFRKQSHCEADLVIEGENATWYDRAEECFFSCSTAKRETSFREALRQNGLGVLD